MLATSLCTAYVLRMSRSVWPLHGVYASAFCLMRVLGAPTQGTKTMPSEVRTNADGGQRIRGNNYNVSFCFGLEPTPNSMSHSLIFAPITSG